MTSTVFGRWCCQFRSSFILPCIWQHLPFVREKKEEGGEKKERAGSCIIYGAKKHANIRGDVSEELKVL